MDIVKEVKKINLLIFKQKLVHADAIIWLQGDRLDRGPRTVQLFNQGWTRRIVISGNDLRVGHARPGENNMDLELMMAWLIKHGIKKKDVIIDRKSYNTRDQAINIIQMAKDKKWKNIIIVGSWPYYQFRVFLTFLKAKMELKWPGDIINQFVVLKPIQKPGGRKQSVRILQKFEVQKLQKYRRHLATLNQGTIYLKKYETSHING